MEKRDNEKQNVFIAVIVVGVVTFIATYIISADNHNIFIILFEAVLFLLIMYGIYFGIPRYLRKKDTTYARILKFARKPRIRYWFELESKNVLRIHIYNPKRTKEIAVVFTNLGIRTLRKKWYMQEYPNELQLIGDSFDGFFPLFQGVLKPNEEIIGNLGGDFDGKLAIHYLSGNAPVHNFRDGTYEYVVQLQTFNQDGPFKYPEYSIWLVIKEGGIDRNQDTIRYYQPDSLS